MGVVQKYQFRTDTKFLDKLKEYDKETLSKDTKLLKKLKDKYLRCEVITRQKWRYFVRDFCIRDFHF